MQFIKRLRASDQKTKLLWLIILSVIAFIFVLALWFFNLQSITARIKQPVAPMQKESSPSLLTSFKAGLYEVGVRTRIAVQTAIDSLGGNSIELTPVASSTSAQ